MIKASGCIRPSYVAALVVLLALAGCDTVEPPTPPPTPVDRFPAWSPDGEQIAYLHEKPDFNDDTDTTGLYVLDLASGQRRLVLDGLIDSPDWKPDGSRIAFSSGDIFTVRTDGTDLERITTHGDAFRPRWSPDGTTISYGRSGTQEEVGIWFAHLSDTTFTKFGFGATPADWSPDETRIVYQGQGNQIWTADTSGAERRQLTENHFRNNRAPSWSPDGEWIAWSPITDDGYAVWIMRADGFDAREVVEGGRRPSWSPDSERLVFTKKAPDGDRLVLWTVHRDGSGLQQLTFSPN